MNIYIDCGAYDGNTLDCETLFGFKADKKIAFEVNPKLIKNLDADEVYNKAVWYKDGETTLFVDRSSTPLGTTLFKSKAQKMRNKRMKIKTIDFPKFVEQYRDDYLVVKMDIEGAEFPILDRMIQDGSINFIDELYCEFHPNKVTEYTTTDKLALIERLEKMTKFKEWH